MKGSISFDVVLQVYRPDASLVLVLDAIERQTVLPDQIIIINVEEKYGDASFLGDHDDVEVYHVSRDMQPGTLQNMAADLTGADVMIYMKGGAMPADDRVFYRLLRGLEERRIKMAYARIETDTRSGVIDVYENMIRFPLRSHIRTKEDVSLCGYDSFFASNVCCAYDMELFRQTGGFPAPCIRGEAMLYAMKIINLDYEVAYISSAKVIKNRLRSDRQYFKIAYETGQALASHRNLYTGMPLFPDKLSRERVIRKMKEDGMKSYIARFKFRQRMWDIAFRMGINSNKDE